jgi:hypothetical protein
MRFREMRILYGFVNHCPNLNNATTIVLRIPDWDIHALLEDRHRFRSWLI